ncbi:MAG: hypothetical protein Q9181_005464 [Wetmoreana brouardii]
MAASSQCQVNVPPSEALKRNRSVQFSFNHDAMFPSSTSRSLNERQDQPTQSQSNDGPADEITPIVSNERSRGRRNYATNSEDVDPSGTSHAPSAEITGPTSLSKRRNNGQPRTETETETETEDKRSEGWWKDFVDKYGSVELENKGSVARDHLALGSNSAFTHGGLQRSDCCAERTFLAWLRTSLAFASIGVAITQLFRLNTTLERREGRTEKPDSTYHLRQLGKPLGATFLGISIVVLLVGGRRYFESQHWIIRGKFPASRGSIMLVTFIAASLIIASLVAVLAVSPATFEKR